MTILLWICAGMAIVGVGAILLGLFGKGSGYQADDAMAEAMFVVVGCTLLGISGLVFLLLTAIKAWS